MDLKNGYKVVYEKATNGKRTFYASKSNSYPAADDAELASFNDADFAGKVIYEQEGKLYVSTGSIPTYNENGEPADAVVEGFEEVFVGAGVNTPSHAPVHPEPVVHPAYTEAISTNRDSHGTLTVADNVVTLNATGNIKLATNPRGNTYHHVGFKITAPDGIDPSNVIITRPDGKTRVMANILDEGATNYTNMYWKLLEDDRVFTYYIDWNNDGVNDLTVVIDATKATLVPEVAE